jgi:flagellar protein FliJ
MRRFKFRLQRVLDFREVLEDHAKSDYLEARARRLDSENQASRIVMIRNEALKTHVERVDQMIALETYLTKLDDDERAQEAVISILIQEEEKALEHWHERRKEAEALRKLKDSDRQDYELHASREAQKELDEFAIQRRAGA